MKRRGIFESTILNKSFLALKLNMLLLYTLTAEANYLVETSKNLRSSNSAWQVEFEEDFSAYDLGAEPENLFFLDGAYSVTENSNQKVLTLPGNPVGDFGFLFGPRVREKTLELQFIFKSDKKGRRYPSIAAGIGGMRGFRFRLNPAAKKILLHADDLLLGDLPFMWKPNEWWCIRFRAKPISEEKSEVKLKVWACIEDEPVKWFFSEVTDFGFKGGKCVIWGYPYSGTEILFDNLIILSRSM